MLISIKKFENLENFYKNIFLKINFHSNQIFHEKYLACHHSGRKTQHFSRTKFLVNFNCTNQTPTSTIIQRINQSLYYRTLVSRSNHFWREKNVNPKMRRKERTLQNKRNFSAHFAFCWRRIRKTGVDPPASKFRKWHLAVLLPLQTRKMYKKLIFQYDYAHWNYLSYVFYNIHIQWINGDQNCI